MLAENPQAFLEIDRTLHDSVKLAKGGKGKKKGMRHLPFTKQNNMRAKAALKRR